jgi:ubiquinone/menaquinone biosynthesis C-methylase UbiE
MAGWYKKREIMHRYDVTACMYDMRYAEEQKAKIEAALRNLTIGKRDFVLDAGCGTGLLFGYVDCRAVVVGVDISRKTLFQAKENAKDFWNVHLVLADADNMPLKESVFSHVFAFTLIQNMPDPVRTLNEVNRIAKPEGAIVVTGLKSIFSREGFEELLRNAGLKIAALEDEDLKCYVAVCTKSVY